MSDTDHVEFRIMLSWAANGSESLTQHDPCIQFKAHYEEDEPLMRRRADIFRDFGKATGHTHMVEVFENFQILFVEPGLSNDMALERVQNILIESGR